ncbi:MAG: transposase [Chloroflexota bacterium]
MAIDRRSYTEEFKREVVQLMETSGKPVAQVARDLGVSDNNLYRWRGLYGSHQQQARANGRPASVVELEAEVKRLRHENEVLRQERDILKHISASVCWKAHRQSAECNRDYPAAQYSQPAPNHPRMGLQSSFRLQLICASLMLVPDRSTCS